MGRRSSGPIRTGRRGGGVARASTCRFAAEPDELREARRPLRALQPPRAVRLGRRGAACPPWPPATSTRREHLHTWKTLLPCARRRRRWSSTSARGVRPTSSTSPVSMGFGRRPDRHRPRSRPSGRRSAATGPDRSRTPCFPAASAMRSASSCSPGRPGRARAGCAEAFAPGSTPVAGSCSRRCSSAPPRRSRAGEAAARAAGRVRRRRCRRRARPATRWQAARRDRPRRLVAHALRDRMARPRARPAVRSGRLSAALVLGREPGDRRRRAPGRAGRVEPRPGHAGERRSRERRRRRCARPRGRRAGVRRCRRHRVPRARRRRPRLRRVRLRAQARSALPVHQRAQLGDLAFERGDAVLERAPRQGRLRSWLALFRAEQLLLPVLLLPRSAASRATSSRPASASSVSLDLLG